VILRILAQESLDLESRLQRYGEKKLERPICNFWKWLGLYPKLFLKIRGLLGILWTAADFKETKGPLCKIPKITDF
jgi:hypothetical protein